MNRNDTLGLQRLLSGELDSREEDLLRQRLAGEPELRQAYESLQATWEALELPDPSAAPVGMAQRISRSAVGRASERVRWSLAPARAQAAAAGALALGVALGLGVASSFATDGSQAVDETWEYADETSEDGDGTSEDAQTTLAEAYWLALDETAADFLDGGSEP